jgi:hypothetical protein
VTEPWRPALAVLAAGLAGTGAVVGLLLLGRMLRPTSVLVRRGRLPRPVRRALAWARSRSLRAWCPEPATAEALAQHLAARAGRSTARLGVSLVDEPARADVVVVRAGGADVSVARAVVPPPCSTIVLADPDDGAEVRAAWASLSAALRDADPYPPRAEGP